jgi:AraC-like DNA-binding protein
MREETKRAVQRTRMNQAELVEILSRTLPEDGGREIFPGLLVRRTSRPTESLSTVYHPAFCFIAQGCKQAQVGDEIFTYDPEHYMIYTVDLPLIFRITEASVERPYFGFALSLDPTIVASVILESDLKLRKGERSAKAMNVGSVDTGLLDAVVRLIRLVESPAERKVLAPLIIREIVFRLLMNGQGSRLSHLLGATDTQRISKAIVRLREHFDEPLRIDDIAREIGMSVSGFHQHFRSVTALSPLQYQKQIRLQEARRLMLGEDLDAASAGFRVGYEDPSYFSRDYKKQFGAPPQRDIARLRSMNGS